MDNYNIKSKTNYRQTLEENPLMQTSKQTIIIIIEFVHVIDRGGPCSQILKWAFMSSTAKCPV
jgi:hypothetical protein